MYTTTGEKLTWAEFDARVAKGEKIFIGNYPEEDKRTFKAFAHSHTIEETKAWLENRDFSLDIMYPGCYDEWNGECAGIRCKDGWLWN